MFEMMRKVFGPIAVTVIIGAIALVFVFYGVFNPRGGGGLGGADGAVAATVNGDSILMNDYLREYKQRVDFYSNMMKGKADPNLLKQLGLPKQVVEELIRRKLILQEAEKAGLTVSDEEIRDKIRQMPYFNKDGKFDAAQYRQVLAANRLDASRFEEMVREDALRAHLIELMRGSVKVSDQEVEKEFQTSEDRRQVDYIMVSRDLAKKKIMISDKEVDDFLKTEAGMSAAKTHYEQNKMDFVKPGAKTAKKDTKKAAGKKDIPEIEFYPFEEVKRKVAVEVLRNRRTEEVQKLTKELATEVFNKARTASPAELRAYAKSKGLEVKTSEKFNRLQPSLSGIGEAPELISDAFKADSVLGKEPKMYETNLSYVIAENLKTFKPEQASFTKDREKLMAQVSSRKEQAFYEQWMGDLRARAKISINDGLNEVSVD